MALPERIRSATRRLAGSDDPRSLAGRARRRRWQEFQRRFPQISELHVFDLGGTPRFWRAAPVRPRQVTVVNLIAEPAEESWIDSREGDATVALDERFDLVFSNSLIEHLPHAGRAEFAAVVDAAAPCHWIQTPAKHFPIEPHWLFPGAQYLGSGARRWLAHNWPASNFAELPDELIEQEVRNIRLFNKAEFASLFPASEIWHERFAGLTKSLVAVRDGSRRTPGAQ